MWAASTNNRITTQLISFKYKSMSGSAHLCVWFFMFLNEYQAGETFSQFEKRAYNFIWKKKKQSSNFSRMNFKSLTWHNTTNSSAQWNKQRRCLELSKTWHVMLVLACSNIGLSYNMKAQRRSISGMGHGLKHFSSCLIIKTGTFLRFISLFVNP